MSRPFLAMETVVAPGSIVTLKSQALSAEVSTLGAELQRLTTADGLDLQWSGDPKVWSGRAPILFPIIGRLREDRYRLDGKSYPMPKHGFARRSTFEVVKVDHASATLRLAASEETLAVYPFDFRLDLTFTLEAATLTVAASVSNHGDRPMPASLGFHPALRWPLPFGRPRPDHHIRFDRPEPEPIRRIDGDGLLTPRPHETPVDDRSLMLRDDLFTDDALIFDRPASRRVVYGADGGPRIAVAFPDFPVLGVWTKPGAEFICIEPWDGLPDPEGFEGEFRAKPGVFEVPPGGSRDLTMTLSLLPETTS